VTLKHPLRKAPQPTSVGISITAPKAFFNRRGAILLQSRVAKLLPDFSICRASFSLPLFLREKHAETSLNIWLAENNADYLRPEILRFVFGSRVPKTESVMCTFQVAWPVLSDGCT